MELGIFSFSGIFPCRNMTEIVIIPQGFILFSLKAFIKMAAAGFPPCQRIDDHEFSEFQKIGHTSGPLEALVKIPSHSGDLDVFPEFAAKGLDEGSGFGQAFIVSGHSAIFPENTTQFPVKIIHRAFTVNGQQTWVRSLALRAADVNSG